VRALEFFKVFRSLQLLNGGGRGSIMQLPVASVCVMACPPAMQVGCNSSLHNPSSGATYSHRVVGGWFAHRSRDSFRFFSSAWCCF